MANAGSEADFRKLLGLPQRVAEKAEREMDGKPHLTADRKVRREAKAKLIDARRADNAVAAIGGELPGKNESVHIAISGRHSLWDFVPACLEISRRNLDSLTIATLGFSKRNVAAMCRLVDEHRAGAVSLLCSHYFAGTSKPIYDFAVDEFAKRPAMKFLSIRTHAKIVLMKFDDGRCVSIESSANLRSCDNIEQATLFGDPGVYNFHSEWIADLFEQKPTRSR